MSVCPSLALGAPAMNEVWTSLRLGGGVDVCRSVFDSRIPPPLTSESAWRQLDGLVSRIVFVDLEPSVIGVERTSH
jgi:hypothetical protein